MARRNNEADETNLDTSDIHEPHFDAEEAQEKMRRILEGSKKGGATTREMIRFAKENMGKDWRARALGAAEGSKGDQH